MINMANVFLFSNITTIRVLMSSESRLNKENENIKKLFNFNRDEATLNQIKETIQHSESGPQYLINLLEYYSKCRPHEHDVCKELVEYVFSLFNERTNEFEQHVNDLLGLFKRYSVYLPQQKYISNELMD